MLTGFDVKRNKFPGNGAINLLS